MQEYWESYVKAIDAHKSSVSFNASFKESREDEGFNYVGFVQMTLLQPNEHGQVSANESDMLAMIEDRLEMEALRYRCGKYVGRIVSNGELFFIYYLKEDFEWQNAVTAAMSHFKTYDYTSHSKLDMAFEIYDKLLFPTPKQWQLIVNHHACDALQEQGDALHMQRAIEHTAYFKTQEELQTFSAAVVTKAFTIQKEFDALLDEQPLFGVQFYRQDSAHYHDIDALTLELIDAAALCNGQYDGWESSKVLL